ncbi:CvpA family protein [Neisseria lisongii]|uniref:CvpA family protein n=1 Tax=Neisseria lisongii TaxID=2912188 RepID=A0AAW5AHS1_9NEIS|nr:CvpA family protein [Neisseria lisongii]
MNSLPVADLLAALVVGACIIMSLMRGVVAEVCSLITWVVAFFAAKWFAVPFAGVAFASVKPQALAVCLAFLLLFFAAWLVQRFIRSMLTMAVSAVGLGGFNRLLGGVFGAVKGILVMTLAAAVCSFTDLPQTEAWQTSYSMPFFEQTAHLLVPYVAEHLQPESSGVPE